MTLQKEQTSADLSPSAENPLTLWGYSPSALHDLFWLSKEVAVVRSGSTAPMSADARLFMLVPSGRLFRLHLRLILDRLFWMPRDLYFIGLNPPSGRQSTRSINNEAPAAAVSMGSDRRPGTSTKRIVDHCPLCVENAMLPARLALTPHRQIAEFWQTLSTRENLWMRLRRRYRDFGSLRLTGLTYADSGDQAMDYLQMLARDWPDPESTIPGIVRLARQVYGPEGFDISDFKNTIRPIWIGQGRTSTESTIGILPDAVPATRAAIPDLGRKK